MGLKKINVGICILVILSSFPCTGQKKGSSLSDSLNLMLDNLIEQNFPDFNGSILVSQSDHLTLRSYGWTDFDRTGMITSESRFNVGSLAKEIPGIIILDLLLSGNLNMNDSIGQFFENLPEPLSTITIDDLLFYKSGLPALDFEKIKMDDQAWIIFPSIELEFEPGSDYLYSNWNNLVQVFVIETIMKSDFRTIVASKYFEPLKVNNSFFDGSRSPVTKNMTKSFSYHFGNDESDNPRFKDFQFSYGPLFMTIQDVYKWIEYISTKFDQTNQIIDSFFRPTTLENQGPLGQIKRNGNSVLSHQHGGYAYSYGLTTYRNYNTQLTIIIMTNNHNNLIPKLQNSIIKIIEDM